MRPSLDFHSDILEWKHCMAARGGSRTLVMSRQLNPEQTCPKTTKREQNEMVVEGNEYTQRHVYIYVYGLRGVEEEKWKKKNGRGKRKKKERGKGKKRKKRNIYHEESDATKRKKEVARKISRTQYFLHKDRMYKWTEYTF